MRLTAFDLLGWKRPYGSPPITWGELLVVGIVVAVFVIIKIIRDHRR